ncbi:hypothetical protein ABT282_32265 [Streptomyces sp. NPDC000927]|uniref:hypothetical protein n=1 Tax=unclassified Streptomyces TaxID=2593676 RepID=UPI003324E480
MSVSEEEHGAGEPPVLAGVEDLGSEGRFRRARATGGTGAAPLEIWLGEPVVLRIDFVPAPRPHRGARPDHGGDVHGPHTARGLPDGPADRR